MTPSSQRRAVPKYGWPSASYWARMGAAMASSSAAERLPYCLLSCSRLMMTMTWAACSAPMTETRELGQVKRKRGP